jgi:NADH-quinone oxidoreductase subunit J
MIHWVVGLMTHVILLIVVLIFTVLAVEFKNLLRAAISLAIASGVLAVAFYQLDSPYAAVIELSVCAGLITVLFMTTISLTHEREDVEE